jgi:hypothetical protein
MRIHLLNQDITTTRKRKAKNIRVKPLHLAVEGEMPGTMIKASGTHPTTLIFPHTELGAELIGDLSAGFDIHGGGNGGSTTTRPASFSLLPRCP